MKYIFDFDNVLFHTSERFTKNLYLVLEEFGVTKTQVDNFFKEKEYKHFVFRELLEYFNIRDAYTRVMDPVPNFNNEELLLAIQNVGKDNCFIVSFGNTEFQMDKIERTGIKKLFSKIIIVPETKKFEIEKICKQFPEEEIYFIDDKPHHFDDLDLTKYPKLRPIQFTNTAQLRDALPHLFQHK